MSHAFAPSRIVGALRWSRMVDLLASAGYMLDVVSVAPAASSVIEQSMLDALPPGTRIFTVPEPGPGPWNRMLAALVQARRRGVAWSQPATASSPARSGATAPERPKRISLARSVRRALIFLAHDEAEVRWAEAAAVAVRRHLDLGAYRAIVSSGPPHYVHVMAGALARRSGRPHVADLRDPWARWSWLGEEYTSFLFLTTRIPREASVVANAALVTTTSDRQSDALRRAYPKQAAHVHTVLNGTDDAPLPPPTDDGVFRISFAGLLYLDRDPTVLFRAIRGFLDSTGTTPAQVRVEFMGDVELIGERPVRNIANAAGIGPWLTLTPSRPRAEAMMLLARSRVLINFAERLQETIAAKIFEYVRFPAWILLIGPDDSATHDLLRGSHALSAAPDDAQAMQRHLESTYASWRKSGRPRPITELLPLSRTVQARRLAELLDRLFAPAT